MYKCPRPVLYSNSFHRSRHRSLFPFQSTKYSTELWFWLLTIFAIRFGLLWLFWFPICIPIHRFRAFGGFRIIGFRRMDTAVLGKILEFVCNHKCYETLHELCGEPNISECIHSDRALFVLFHATSNPRCTLTPNLRMPTWSAIICPLCCNPSVPSSSQKQSFDWLHLTVKYSLCIFK